MRTHMYIHYFFILYITFILLRKCIQKVFLNNTSFLKSSPFIGGGSVELLTLLEALRKNLNQVQRLSPKPFFACL